MAQFGGSQIQRIAIRRQNSPCQRIRRRVIAQFQNLLVAIGRINIDGQNRAKELLAHGPVFGIGRLNQGGFDKIPFGLVTAPPNEDFAIGMLFGFVDGRLQFVKRLFVNDGVDKVAEIFDTAHFHVLQIGPDPFQNLWP